MPCLSWALGRLPWLLNCTLHCSLALRLHFLEWFKTPVLRETVLHATALWLCHSADNMFLLKAAHQSCLVAETSNILIEDMLVVRCNQWSEWGLATYFLAEFSMNKLLYHLIFKGLSPQKIGISFYKKLNVRNKPMGLLDIDKLCRNTKSSARSFSNVRVEKQLRILNFLKTKYIISIKIAAQVTYT